MVRSNFPIGKFAEKLEEFGIPKKEAGELEFHLLELDISVDEFRDNISKVIKCKSNEKDKAKELLEGIWGDLEFHLVPNHLNNAKRILNKISDELSCSA